MSGFTSLRSLVRRQCEAWAGSWSAARPDTRSLAHLLGLQYLVGAGVTLAGLVLPAADTSDRPGLAVIGSLALASGLYLRFGKHVSSVAVDCSISFIVFLVTASIMISRPMGLEPLFYFWPLMLSAYYASPTQLAVNTALAIATFAFALATTAETSGRPLLLIEFAAVVLVVVAAVARLRSKAAGLLEQLRDAALIDDLTGTLNRRGFREAVDAMVADRGGTFVDSAFLAIDVDHFKKINDRFGHSGGDEALQRLAVTVAACIRPGDVFGRIGGEEFSLVLRDANPSVARFYGEQIRRAVAQQSKLGLIPITISVGIAFAPTASKAWEAADGALYEAKRAGRDRTHLAGPAPAVLAVVER